MASDKLPQEVVDFVAGGADDEVTLRRNRSAFESLLLCPRYLRDVERRDLSTTVLGEHIALPVLVGPTGHQNLVHHDAELATVRAAARMGTVAVVSTVASHPLEQVAAATDGPLWFQLYCFKSRAITERLVERAERAGYRALCLTIDVPVLGRRERDIRSGFDLFALDLPNLHGMVGDESRVTRNPESGVGCAGAEHDASLTWDDIEWIIGLSSLPLVIKGVLGAADARRAVECGAAAVVVSNHGGRQLDGVPSTIEMLPEVVDAVGDSVEVLIDGGIRRGTDVIKALALGARAVLLGRPVLWGLAVAGCEGVERVLSMLREELDVALALVGHRSVKDLDRSVVRGREPAFPRVGPT